MRNKVTLSDPRGCLVALGSNQEWSGVNPMDILSIALSHLKSADFFITKVSKFYQTPCFPVGAGPDYVNAAIVIRTNQDSSHVLKVLHDVEATIGRERVQRWGMRTLDLDLLAVGQEIAPSEAEFMKWKTLDPALQSQAAPDKLILPHPRIQDRAFVLGPLNDIVPDWRHPVLGKTVREMFMALPAEQREELKVL